MNQKFTHYGKRISFPVIQIGETNQEAEDMAKALTLSKTIRYTHTAKKKSRDYSKVVLMACGILWVLIYGSLIYFKVLR